MKPPSLRTDLYLLVDISLLVLCLLHIPKVLNRPMAPFEVGEQDDRVAVTRIIDTASCGGIQAGDLLVSWQRERIAIPEMVEYVADLSSIGSNVQIHFERKTARQSAIVTLIPYYSSARFLIISLFTGLTMFGLGFFILLNRPRDVAARALHLCMITFGTTIMITWGAITLASWETYLSRTIWFIAYLGVAVSFFCFTLLYPRERIRWLGEHSWIPVPFVVAAGTLFSLSNLSALQSATSDGFQTFQTLFDIFHGSLFVFVGGGIFSIASASLSATTAEERQKLYWILWGICIGIAPYLFLHILPQIVWSRYIIPEEYTTIFFLAIPVAFTISLLKYKLFDIEVVINRTIVYVILSVFLVACYMLVVLLITSVVGEEMVFKKYILVVGLTLVVGLLVNPLRLKLQRVVDETLFTARANFRRAVTQITAELHEAFNRDDLFSRMVEGVHRVVPSQMLAVYERRDGSLALKSFLGIRPKDDCALADNLEKALKARRVLAQRNVVRGDVPLVETAHEEFLADCGWSLCIPMTAEGGELFGVLVMSPRTLHEHYDEEEINLLHTVCSQATDILERLILQEEIILAQEEKKRSEELSALKSYFVSSVSHELRMPLTSIRMFAEMLRSGKAKSPRRQREYLEIIEGESERLSRLIGNILDFAKIERGVKEYEFREVRLQEIIRRSVNAMRYQFEKHAGKLRVRVKKGIPVVTADGDALEEAVLNLLSNALKYSIRRKEVTLRVFKRSHRIVIEVADKGIGIPESELAHIFDRFYRVRDDRTRQIGGAGLGLALVKHIVDAHHGRLSIKSTDGKGSTFTIELPIRQPNERSRG
jgi:signal transduction histidine kinase